MNNPAFLFTLAVIQAGVLLVGIRFLDVYGRQPLGLVALVAAWGATGAAALSVAGNHAVKGLLHGDVLTVFGDAVSAPLVEEAAKGLALLVAVGPVRLVLRRAGVNLFEGIGAGMVYGAAVGLGFGFTEDVYYLVDKARSAGIDAGFNTFFYRRDFFGPAILHHAVFTAAFGAGLGLATWSTSRIRKALYPVLGFVTAVLMHAANNGLVELILDLKYGVAETARWTFDPASVPAAADTASSVRRLMRALDFYYLAMFVGIIVFWTRRQRAIIQAELEQEVERGLITDAEYTLMFDAGKRMASDWRLLRGGQLEQLRHDRRLRRALAQLGLLKHRTERFGGDVSRVNRARREIATLSTYEVRTVKLPVPPSALVGRERELAEISAALLDHDVRVVTLLGPGGTGKTRLSIEVASLHRNDFPGGVYFVELAAIDDPELVPGAIAEVLEIQPAAGQSVLAALQDHLQDKQLLLVLDNFEQVAAAAPSVADILRVARRVSVLVSSRQALRISGEHEYPVPPLQLPDPKAPDPANAAMVLFVDRARAIDAEFTLTPSNSAAVAEICVAVDGLPLAIELAAARINVLTPEAMRDRLGSHLQMLSGGARDLPARHQALRSTIDWSYEMLPPAERGLFIRLGVFAGGASFEAVEQVCLSGDGSTDTVIDAVSSLRDKSLVRRDIGAGGEPRFSMLATIRKYAAERLDATGELAELRQRHADHYARFAEEAEKNLAGEDQLLWFERLDREVGNFRAVLQFADGGDGARLEYGLRVTAALPRYWSMRGLADPPRWLSAALDRDGEAVTNRGSASVHAKALFADGYAALDHGDLPHAEARFEASAAAYRELDEPRGTAASLAQLAFLVLGRGDVDRAVDLADDAVRGAQQVGDRNVESVAISTLADAAARTGDYDRATELYEQALALRRSLGDRRNIANALLNLGRVALAAGQTERARALLEQGLAIGREVNDSWSISVGLASLGRLHLLEGREVDGIELLVQALDLAVERGGRWLAAECVTALAAAALRSDPQRAAQLFGAAETIRRGLGVTLSRMETSPDMGTVGDARTALGEYEFTVAWQAGLALNLADAAAFARSGVAEPSASR